uniref:Protection of telomeres protein 1 ssDNA-binding domain-containing protein n=1 Tax=Panagrolaimus davidi TaxID=227884 RepID=A0A914QYB0_9BILA
MDELIYGNSCYYDVLFQIVSCYKNGKGNVVLRVWDGLQNPNQLFISPSYDIRLIYGDLKRERLIAEQKKLYDVICYDEHGRSAAGLKAGDYIALINVHFYCQYPGFLPTLIMHKGAGKRGNSVAGRRIIKLTKETATNYFDIIDGLIKEHEKSLSTVEENQINNIAQPLPTKSLPLRSNLVEEYDSDDSFYDDSLFQTVETNQVTVPATSLQSTNSNALANIAADTISTIPDVAPSSKRNDTLITIAPTTSQPTTAAVAPVLTITTPHVVSIPAISQCSTITLSSDDGSTQSSCIIISQRSPEKNNETITLSSTPATPIPISSRSTALQKNATILPIPTVSNISPTLNIPFPSAIRRSATVAFPQTHNPEPPSKRLCLCGLTNDNEEEESSTQALFDKLQDIENDGDYLNETTLSLTEEQKKINAITDTQLERMWEEVENAQLQPSQSISQWGTWNR